MFGVYLLCIYYGILTLDMLPIRNNNSNNKKNNIKNKLDTWNIFCSIGDWIRFRNFGALNKVQEKWQHLATKGIGTEIANTFAENL